MLMSSMLMIDDLLNSLIIHGSFPHCPDDRRIHISILLLLRWPHCIPVFTGKIRLPQEGVLGNASTALLCISFTDILQWTPFFVIILLAGIQSIPDEIEVTMGAPGTSSRTWCHFIGYHAAANAHILGT